MGETGTVLLVRGPSTGGIGRHVAALAAALPAYGWTVTTLAVPGDPRAVPAIRRAAAGTDVVHAHGHRLGWWACTTSVPAAARRMAGTARGSPGTASVVTVQP